jgi:hypothetical protein
MADQEYQNRVYIIIQGNVETKEGHRKDWTSVLCLQMLDYLYRKRNFTCKFLDIKNINFNLNALHLFMKIFEAE